MRQSCSDVDFARKKLADDGEEVPGGQFAHQEAGQSLHRAEQPPLVRQHQITVTQRGGLGSCTSKIAIRAARDLPASQIISSLRAAVVRFADGTRQLDDLTAVVVKRLE